jgi:hypothetical protein
VGNAIGTPPVALVCAAVARGALRAALIAEMVSQAPDDEKGEVHRQSNGSPAENSVSPISADVCQRQHRQPDTREHKQPPTLAMIFPTGSSPNSPPTIPNTTATIGAIHDNRADSRAKFPDSSFIGGGNGSAGPSGR